VPTALFVCYGGGHVQMVLPVVRALGERPGWTIEVLAATTAGPEMARRGVPAFGYAALVRDGDGDALRLGEGLLAESHNPASGISVEESTAYLGLCFRDLIDRLGETEARLRYEIYGRHAFLPIGPLRRAVDRVRPDVVVTTNSPKSERAALLVAHERAIPAIYIEDLLGFAAGAHLKIVPPPVAERFCVGSTIAAESLARRYGVPADRLRLTGNPAFDRLAHIGASARIDGRSALGVGSNERLVVYMDPRATAPQILGGMAAEVRRVPNTRFFLRRHPNDRGMAAADYLSAVGADIGLAEQIGLDDLLAAADVVLSVASTTALEAVLIGKQVIQLGDGTGIPGAVGDHVDQLPLYRYGCATLVEHLADLAGVIEAVSGSTGSETVEAARKVFVAPGSAASAVTDEIDSLARAP
jgi:capsular polysaccharide biosynthesis protein